MPRRRRKCYATWRNTLVQFTVSSRSTKGRYRRCAQPSVATVEAKGLRSLEEGFIPPVLDESVLDGKIVVDSRASFAATKELTREQVLAMARPE